METLYLVEATSRTNTLWRPETRNARHHAKDADPATQRPGNSGPQQLRDLETAGLIHRKVYAEVPPKVEYSLTDFGHTLRPMVDFVSGWGIKNSEQINQALGALGRV